MSEQAHLPGVEPAVTLTERQQHALDVVREHGPIQSEDVGAHLHAWRVSRGGRGHHVDDGCEWCGSEGASTARILERKGLVRRIRGEGWVDADYRTPVEEVLGYDPHKSEIPY